MPDDHSKVVPLLPIPNRTVKRLCADDSADSRVKVGHRQALTATNTPSVDRPWGFCVYKCEGPLDPCTLAGRSVDVKFAKFILRGCAERDGLLQGEEEQKAEGLDKVRKYF
jgi:hypothetical protein